MSVYALNTGSTERFVKKLTTTSVTDLGIATNAPADVVDLWFCEITNATTDITVEIFTNSTSFYLFKNRAVTAKEAFKLDIDTIHLNKGDQLRVTVADANKIDVYATIVRTSQ